MRVVATACAVFLLFPSAAAAGGWWTSIRLDRTKVAVGQEVKAHANVLFSSVDAVEAAQSGREDETFYVYLLRGLDFSVVERAMRKASPGDWWTPDSAAPFRVGRVVIGGGDSNLALANASFRVPDLPAGRYSVMFCNAGCERPLGDVIPSWPPGLTVVAQPAKGSRWADAAWFAAGALVAAAFALVLRQGRAASPPTPRTAGRVARPRSSSRGGRSPGPRRRSARTSSQRG